MTFEFKNTVLFISILLFSFGCASKKKIIQPKGNQSTPSSNILPKERRFKTGAENYDAYLPLLANKRVGIVTNPTGIVENKKHLVDFLLEKQITFKKYTLLSMDLEELQMQAN